MLNEKIICAGFGGQGVMALGQILAYGGMLEGKHVTWLPSYGPEMRGGTAYCCVMVADAPVGSPVITDDATCAIIMNMPSLLKFESRVAAGGDLLINSSLINRTPRRRDLIPHLIPANDIARECGDERSANMVMLGAYLGLRELMSVQNTLNAFGKVFGSKSKSLVRLNRLALEKGLEQTLPDQNRCQAA